MLAISVGMNGWFLIRYMPDYATVRLRQSLMLELLEQLPGNQNGNDCGDENSSTESSETPIQP